MIIDKTKRKTKGLKDARRERIRLSKCIIILTIFDKKLQFCAGDRHARYSTLLQAFAGRVHKVSVQKVRGAQYGAFIY